MRGTATTGALAPQRSGIETVEVYVAHGNDNLERKEASSGWSEAESSKSFNKEMNHV